MIQVKNFLVVTMMWAVGMVALTAARAALQTSPSADSTDATALVSRN
jgi:hypothetical protein